MKAGQILSHIRAVLPSCHGKVLFVPQDSLIVCVHPRMRQLKGRDLWDMLQGGLAGLRMEGRIRKAVTQGLPAVAQVWL